MLVVLGLYSYWYQQEPIQQQHKTTTTTSNNFHYSKHQCAYNCTQVVTEQQRHYQRLFITRIYTYMYNNKLYLQYWLTICDKCDSVVYKYFFVKKSMDFFTYEECDLTVHTIIVFDPRSCDIYVRNVCQMRSYFSQLWRIGCYSL